MRKEGIGGLGFAKGGSEVLGEESGGGPWLENGFCFRGIEEGGG